MAKRFLAMAIAICMLVMMVPFSASADTVIEVANWAEFDAAFGQGSAANPVTIVLTDDIEMEWRYGWIDNKYVTVITDGGDYTITNAPAIGNNNWMEFWGNNDVTFGSLDSGKITFISSPVDPTAENDDKYAPFFLSTNTETDVVTFNNCEFTTNYGEKLNSLGAIRVGNGTVNMNGCKIYNSKRGMTISNGTVNLTDTEISGNGNLTGVKPTGYELKGAGIHLGNGTLNLYGCTITGNVSHGSYSGGGGIYITSGTANLYANDEGTPTVISNNTSYETSGGIWVSGGSSVANIYNAEIINNSATGAGGGMYLENGGKAYMYDGKINGNATTGTYSRGGAVRVSGSNSVFEIYGGEIIGNTGNEKGPCIEVNSATLVIGDAEGGPVISGNVGTHGGAVFGDGSAKIKFVNGTIENNAAKNGGGAFYLDSSSSLEMTGGTITGNYTTGAWDKRGAAIHAASSSTVVIKGGTIEGNYHEGNTTGGGNNYGGVHFGGQSMTIGGDVVINDDLTIADGKVVTIDPALTNEISVWQKNFTVGTQMFDGLIASSFDKIVLSDENYSIGADGTVIEAGSDPNATPAPTAVPTDTPVPTAAPTATPEPTPAPTFNPLTGIELWAHDNNLYYTPESGTTEFAAGEGEDCEAKKYFNDGPDARIEIKGPGSYITFYPNASRLEGIATDVYVYVFGEYGYPELIATVTYDGGKTEEVTIISTDRIDAGGNKVAAGEAFGKKVPVYVGNYTGVESVKVEVKAVASKPGLGIWKAEFLADQELPVITYVAEVDGVKYETLAEAVEKAADGATVTLLDYASGAGVKINKDITIDFGGFTYTLTEGVGSTGTESNGFQILKDNTVVLKNGKLEVAEESKDKFYTIIQNYADLTVEDMTLDGTNLDKWSLTDGDSYVLSVNSGDVFVTGATNIIANDEGDLAFAFDSCEKASYEAPVVTVTTTGTIDGKIESTGGAIAISGGTYTVALDKAWCAEGYVPADNDDGTYGVREAKYVAEVNGVKYESLAEAVEDAEEGDEIFLLCDAEGDGIVIDKSIAINFGGNTYTVSGAPVGSAGTKRIGFQILKNNNVILKNGTVAVATDEVKMLVQNYSSLTLESVTLDGTGSANMLYVLSNNSGNSAIIGATNITAPEGAVAFDVYDFSSSGYPVPRVGVNTTGKVTGAIEVSETATLAISGGTYTVALDPSWCAEGYVPADNDDGTYGVKEGKYVAEADGVKYETLADAVEKAANGSTVTLLDYASGAGVKINKDITIDFGGFTYTLTEGVGSTGTESNGFQILKDNTVVLKNGKLEVAEESKDKFYTIIQNYADLTVEDMTLDGTNLDKWSLTDGDSYVLSVNSGDVFVTGATNIIANDEGDLAFAFDSCKKASYEAPVVTVTTTGTIDGKIESTGGAIAIAGGTYTVALDPSWCAEGYVPADNNDGTYGVKLDYSIAITADDKVVTTGVEEDAVIILASYAGTRLVDVQYFAITEDADVAIADTELVTDGATSVTAMLVKDVTNIRPLCANATK